MSAFETFESVNRKLKCWCVFRENRWQLLYSHSKSLNVDENRCTVTRFHRTSINIVVRSSFFIRNRWTSIYGCVLSFKIYKIVLLSCLLTVVSPHSKSSKIVVPSCLFIRNRWNTWYYRAVSFAIDESRCTMMFFHQQSMKIVVLSFKLVENCCIYRLACSLQIDENCCTGVLLNQKSMKTVVLSCLFHSKSMNMYCRSCFSSDRPSVHSSSCPSFPPSLCPSVRPSVCPSSLRPPLPPFLSVPNFARPPLLPAPPSARPPLPTVRPSIRLSALLPSARAS